MKRLLHVLTVILLLPVLLTGGDKRKAPDFTLKTADGRELSLSSLKGKVVVLNFWATWCGPCRREIPDFLDVYKDYKEKGIEIVGISLDRDGWTAVSPYLEKTPIAYPIVIGNGTLARQYGNLQYIPTTFVVDKEGYIVSSHSGLMSKAQLIQTLEPLL